MTILAEWFHYGESDLFFIGIAIIVVSILFPVYRNKMKNSWFRVLIYFAIYAISEVVASFIWKYISISWTVIFLLLFIGGASLSITVGRTIRLLLTYFVGMKSKQTR